MKYTLTASEMKALGVAIENPQIDVGELRDNDGEVQVRVITKWASIPSEILKKWRASKELTCLRCDHQWISILTNNSRPRSCPVCKSPYWDRPRRGRPIENITPMIVDVDGKRYRVEHFCSPCDISWPKDLEYLNISCPQCRRKCGANTRRVELEVEVSDGG